MDCSVLLRFNRYFLFFPDKTDSPIFIEDKFVADLPTNQVIPIGRLRELRLPEFSYPIFIHKEPDFIAICPATEIENKPIFWPKQKIVDNLRDKAELIASKWIASQNTRLLKGLFDKHEDLENCVKTFADYTYSNGYSLWIYNPISKVFTCPVTSAPYKKRHLSEKDNSKLFEFIDSKREYESREPIAEACLSPDMAGMKTLNRLLIHYGGDVKGILNLYSKNERFEINQEAIPLIQNALSTKHIESRIESQKALDNIERFCIQEYKSGNLEPFLHGLVCKICQEFSFEGCSVFLREPNTNELVLKATCDLKHKGKPSERVVYDITSKSLTSDVYLSGKLRFSYDLQNDPDNSKTYGESTSLPGTNWIGIPLQIKQNTRGVLRVKNRYNSLTGENIIRNIRSIDFDNILSVGTLLSGILQLEDTFLDVVKEKKTVSKKLEDLNNFNKLFLHEIRTPISTFGLAPFLISRLLTTSQITPELITNVLKKLDDIKIMGERLKFITNSYFITELVTKRTVTPIYVLRDVVFPVLNITREYYRRNYGLEIRLDPLGLEGQVVYGDRILLNIVFNALIDNACKYSYPQKRPVVVSGRINDDETSISLLISNYGMNIDPEERERIFGNGERGRLALENKSPGTGIGLYLSKQIMKNLNGDLLILSLKDPVTFAIILRKAIL